MFKVTSNAFAHSRNLTVKFRITSLQESFLCSRQWAPWAPPPQGSSKILRLLDVESWGVYKFRDWWILAYPIFGHGESSPDNIWIMSNLDRTCILLFYYFLYLKVNLDVEKKIRLVNLHPILFSRWWILTQLFWKRGELLVNPDLTILLKRWTEVKTWGR